MILLNVPSCALLSNWFVALKACNLLVGMWSIYTHSRIYRIIGRNVCMPIYGHQSRAVVPLLLLCNSLRSCCYYFCRRRRRHGRAAEAPPTQTQCNINKAINYRKIVLNHMYTNRTATLKDFCSEIVLRGFHGPPRQDVWSSRGCRLTLKEIPAYTLTLVVHTHIYAYVYVILLTRSAKFIHRTPELRAPIKDTPQRHTTRLSAERCTLRTIYSSGLLFSPFESSQIHSQTHSHTTYTNAQETFRKCVMALSAWWCIRSMRTSTHIFWSRWIMLWNEAPRGGGVLIKLICHFVEKERAMEELWL